MLIYNVTMHVDEAIHDAWLTWMLDQHIPEVLATGKFTKALMTQVLVQEDPGGITYSVQYSCLSREALERYYAEDAPRLREETSRRFGNRLGAFRTELQVVSEISAGTKNGQ